MKKVASVDKGVKMLCNTIIIYNNIIDKIYLYIIFIIIISTIMVIMKIIVVVCCASSCVCVCVCVRCPLPGARAPSSHVSPSSLPPSRACVWKPGSVCWLGNVFGYLPQWPPWDGCKSVCVTVSLTRSCLHHRTRPFRLRSLPRPGRVFRYLLERWRHRRECRLRS